MIRSIFERTWDFIQAYRLHKIKGLELKGNIIVKGSPMIDIAQGAKVIIGHNVTLNSRNHGYHVAMYSPVKLFADYKGAVISIGRDSRIHGSCIHSYNSVTIGKNCLIAANTNIFDAQGHLLSFENISNRIFTRDTQSEAKPVVIEDNVWIGVTTHPPPQNLLLMRLYFHRNGCN
ncbi:MAG: acyltransferase [Nitrospiraceae bacterium]|nr:acyltransferase [Nitrospiraceae bacterium]